MKRSLKVAAVASGAVLLGLGCFKAYGQWVHSREIRDWVWIGTGGPDDPHKFQYRYIEVETDSENIPTTGPDLATLTMDLQSGRAHGAWVYLPVDNCFAPDVRDGLPSVQCYSIENSDVILAAQDGARAKLLSLRRLGQRAAVRAKAMGIYGGSPVLLVVDDRVEMR